MTEVAGEEPIPVHLAIYRLQEDSGPAWVYGERVIIEWKVLYRGDGSFYPVEVRFFADGVTAEAGISIPRAEPAPVIAQLLPERDRFLAMDGGDRELTARDMEVVVENLTVDGLALAYALTERLDEGAKDRLRGERVLRAQVRAGSRSAARDHRDMTTIQKLVRERPIGLTPAEAVRSGIGRIISRQRAYQLLAQAVDLGYLDQSETKGKRGIGGD